MHLAVDRVDVLLAPDDLRLDPGLGELLLDRVQRSCRSLAPVAARRLGRLGEHACSASGRGARSRGPAARGRACSGPGGWRSARRSPASRARCARCFAGGTASSVRMLCRRSASLIRMTRTSRAMASSILRKFSACASCGRLELDAVELGDAVDQLGHRPAEGVGDLVLGDRGVLGRRRAAAPPSAPGRRGASRRGSRRPRAGGRCTARPTCRVWPACAASEKR